MLRWRLFVDQWLVRRVSLGCVIVLFAGLVVGCPDGIQYTDPCDGVTCAAGENCVDGGCVPDEPVDPCADVTCEDGESCVDGACVPDEPAGVSFSVQIQPIFDARCIVCHRAGGVADAIMHLNAEESFDALVGQASVQDATLTRVVAGDSGASLLFLKISSDNPPVGSRMPLGGPALSDEDIALIRDWIDEGAENN